MNRPMYMHMLWTSHLNLCINFVSDSQGFPPISSFALPISATATVWEQRREKMTHTHTSTNISALEMFYGLKIPFGNSPNRTQNEKRVVAKQMFLLEWIVSTFMLTPRPIELDSQRSRFKITSDSVSWTTRSLRVNWLNEREKKKTR